MTATAPRHYMPSTRPGSTPVWSQFGLPQDRVSRMAARRSFVQLKQGFMQAVEFVDGPRGDWLRFQVRQANEPVDLWLLRGPVFSSLPAKRAESQRLRLELHRLLDSVFPDSSDHAITL